MEALDVECGPSARSGARDRRLEPLVFSTTKHHRLEPRLFASPVAVEDRRVQPASLLDGAASRLFPPRPLRARRRRNRHCPPISSRCVVKEGGQAMERKAPAHVDSRGEEGHGGRSMLLQCLPRRPHGLEMAANQTAAPGAEKEKSWCWIRRGAGSEVAWITIAWTMRTSSSAWEQRRRRRSRGWERLCGGEAGAGRRQTTARSRAEEKLGLGQGGGRRQRRRSHGAAEDLKSWAEEDDDGDLKIGAAMSFPAFSPGRKVFPSDL